MGHNILYGPYDIDIELGNIIKPMTKKVIYHMYKFSDDNI